MINIWIFSTLNRIAIQLCAKTSTCNHMSNFHVQLPKCAISNCGLKYLIDMHNLGNSECKLSTQLRQSISDVWLQNYRARTQQEKLCLITVPYYRCVQLWRYPWSIWKRMKNMSWREWWYNSTCACQLGQGLCMYLHDFKNQNISNTYTWSCILAWC